MQKKNRNSNLGLNLFHFQFINFLSAKKSEIDHKFEKDQSKNIEMSRKNI
jgi:hypothetical protein